MKMKSLAMLVMSGLLIASASYIAPALADDNGSSNMQPSANSMGSGMNQGSSNSSSDNNSANSMDQGSPDTATGDDDY